ncbi:hypothetical protein LWI28_003233 [Acer negundo]|uniref:Endonuclease/exonuclease/phosphatase domain-containing protein n=1 Tax=Acer negundo TaxID=4023 RepID=A0AAD5JFT6_ACENE|nr:hypothetical protein LWI28_003233 [Acer negundo]
MMETVSTENEPISILTNILEKENYGDSDKKITRWKRLACDKYEGKIVVGIVKSVRKRDGVSLWEDDNHVAKKGKGRDMSISPEISMEENPRLVFLLETRKKQKDVCSVKGRLGFERGFTVDCISSGGGLMLFWKGCIKVTVKSYTKGHIDAVIKDKGGMVWRFTDSYGDPDHSLRNHSWTLLRRLGGMSRLPWLVAGDFNKILSWEEKQGGLVKSNEVMSAFREVVDECSLIDKGFKGNMFTWSNRQFGEAFIQEWLDRALCCLELRSCFPDVAVVHKEWGGSDHKVLLIDNILNVVLGEKTMGDLDSFLSKLGLTMGIVSIIKSA